MLKIREYNVSILLRFMFSFLFSVGNIKLLCFWLILFPFFEILDQEEYINMLWVVFIPSFLDFRKIELYQYVFASVCFRALMFFASNNMLLLIHIIFCINMLILSCFCFPNSMLLLLILILCISILIRTTPFVPKRQAKFSTFCVPK